MDMELSQNFLRAKSPCAAGFRWFVRNRHDGNDYQRVLDALVSDGRVEDARWLMNQFGPTDAVLEVDHLEADALVFAGSVVVHGELRVPGSCVRFEEGHVRRGCPDRAHPHRLNG